ncbi:MAG: hypothetical protein LBQ32_03550 [Burkholderiaceae bacterium]|nr:hypothetical protein [Burkholderiaceae bacterium]
MGYDYDEHGNVTERRKGAHETTKLTWNAEHQLERAEVTSTRRANFVVPLHFSTFHISLRRHTS